MTYRNIQDISPGLIDILDTLRGLLLGGGYYSMLEILKLK